MRPDGILALHISNRYLDLEPVIGRLAAERGLSALTNRDLDIPSADLLEGRSPTQWVALAVNDTPLSMLEAMRGWRPLERRDGVRAWTDDYSNLLRSIRWD